MQGGYINTGWLEKRWRTFNMHSQICYASKTGGAEHMLLPAKIPTSLQSPDWDNISFEIPKKPILKNKPSYNGWKKVFHHNKSPLKINCTHICWNSRLRVHFLTLSAPTTITPDTPHSLCRALKLQTHFMVQVHALILPSYWQN